jgi:hypothetical protein
MLSNTFVAIFMYHLVKNRLLTNDMMSILDAWIPRHKVIHLLIFRVNTMPDKHSDVCTPQL